MRLWSIHPKYLDTKGLVSLWREGLLARKVLDGKTKGYVHHPQLARFKKCRKPIEALDAYLKVVAQEGKARGYFFDVSKIKPVKKVPKIQVTNGQVMYEVKHLKNKLLIRDIERAKKLKRDKVGIHPLFTVIEGTLEKWENVSSDLKRFPYDLDFKKINFRINPELYKIGIGEQGVLLVEPYKSEILPYWRFKTPEVAKMSAKKIYSLFLEYKRQSDFVGMDMSRKFLQMGFTRSRRYANHSSGHKYDAKTGAALPQTKDWNTNEKALSAKIFYEYYSKVKNNKKYLALKNTHKKLT